MADVEVILTALRQFAGTVTAKMNQLTAGEPEDQLRAPFETFMQAVGQAPARNIVCTGETRLRRLGKPDYAVHSDKILIGYVELKALRIARMRLDGKKMRRIEVEDASAEQRYYVQIVDCAGDQRVKSAICERYTGLVDAGFQAIVGIRDVYPDCAYERILELRRGLASRIRTKPVRVLFVLAVMEIEAWFLAEHRHFAKIHPGLTPTRIKGELGFDPSKDDMQLREHPAADLDCIYRLGGERYGKQKDTALRTIDALDYADIYLRFGEQFPDIQRLVECLDVFLTD